MSDVLRIMVVDDDPDLLDMVSVALEDDFEVVTAVNGQDALDKADDAEPDMFIIDVMMPLLSGWDLIQHLREDPAFRESPVIFLTAKRSRDDVKKGYELGATVYLTKPFSIDRLLRNIRVHVDEGLAPRPKRYTLEELRNPDRPRRETVRDRRPIVTPPPSDVIITPPPDEATRGKTYAPPPPPLPRRDASVDSAPGVGAQAQGEPKLAAGVGRETPRRPASPTPEPSSRRPPSRFDEEEETLDPFSRAERIDAPPPGAGRAKARKEKASVADSRVFDRPVPMPARNIRILVADDDLDILTMAFDSLSETYEVVEARDGLEAMKKSSRFKPDIFVVDGMMPRMSGYQFCNYLHRSAEYREAPVVFMSAKSTPKDREYVKTLRVSRFLSKPFGPDELEEAIDSIANAADFKARVNRPPWPEVMKEETESIHRVLKIHRNEGLAESRSQIGRFLDGDDNKG